MSDQTLPACSFSRLEKQTRLSTETANQITHAIGFVAGVIASTFLMFQVCSKGNLANVIGCSIYAFTMIALYAASTLSHSFDCPDRRRFYRMLDQVCIFLFVVGNFTPFVIVHMPNTLGWTVLTIMWVAALTGCYVRIRSQDKTISARYFILLAWLPVVTMGYMLMAANWTGLAIVLAGGLCYTGGVWFLVNDNRHPYFHAVWHMSTICGTALHFLFTYWYVVVPTIS